MKLTQVRGVRVLMLAGLVVAGAFDLTRAVAETVERDISEFVAAQGTFDLENDILGLPAQFLPPVPNFITFTDPLAELGMSVDYAGLADATCGGIAGTTFRGEVEETVLPDGRALVSVELETENAITYVLDGLSFGSPVIFGTRWEDVEGECIFDAFPALGESELKVTFIIPEPGGPLPDLFAFLVIDLGLAGFYPDQIPEGLELHSLEFKGEAEELLADGTEAEAKTKQKWMVVDGSIVFEKEMIEVKFDD